MSDAKQLAKEIIKEMKDEFTDKHLHNTKLLLKNYNRLKQHVEDVNGDITQKLNELEFESGDEVFINSMIKTKMRTAKMLAYVDESLIILEQEATEKCEHHKYKSFKMFYIDELSVDEIMKEIGCTRKMPYIWNKMMIERLNILLWGVTALHL
ncbi:hypothetical protein NSA24_11860 [Clostridioides mangenotii]|uniref:hypothetical protein n=1 Tax=Metaclostridioides mangenotii TaxID=1540 RepID=UPI00214A406B|nr:hypothetical protein [Clostridioides mangenotii]MCR1955490.1 hypothetical protein [Clostridioides mangenotii]